MFKDLEGQRIPDVTFRARRGHEWVDIKSSEIFDGKSVVVFSLPGAFTPTCSSSHVPRYSQLADRFAEAGINDIVCVSVNDGFVMELWQKEQNADNITFLPDGNGEFTDKMGMLVDKSDLGFGKRSWRYAMVVRDGVIKKMFVEPEEPGDPFGQSDADTVLAYLAPSAPPVLNVSVLSRHGCPHCVRAKTALEEAGLDYEELVLNRDYTDQSLRALSGATTFPQIFVDGKLIGGADEVESWLAGRKAA